MHTPNERSDWPPRPWAWLTIICLIGLALRLYALARHSIWYDEGGILWAVSNVDWTLSRFRAGLVPLAPLLPILLKGWCSLLGLAPGIDPGTVASDFALRSLVALFGIMSIPLLFVMCRVMLKNTETALIAAFLFAISPFQIYYAQELRNYTLYALLGLGVLGCLIRALESDKNRYWAGLTLFLTLSIWNHFYGVWHLAVIDLFFLVTLKSNRKTLRKWIPAHVLVIVLSAIPLLMAVAITRVVFNITVAWIPVPDWKTGFITFKTFFAGSTFRTLAYWPLFLLCGALFLTGLYALRKRGTTLLLAVVFILVPIAANVILWGLRDFSYYEHRLFIFSGVVSYCVVAFGIVTLGKPWLKAAALAAIGVLTVPCLADHYAQRLHPSPAHRLGVRYKVQNREAARYILESLRAEDAVIHASQVSLFPFRYYLPREQYAISLTDAELEGYLSAYPDEAACGFAGTLPRPIGEAVGNARQVWYVESWWEPFDKPPDFTSYCDSYRNWLNERYTLMERKEFFGIVVYRYRV